MNQARAHSQQNSSPQIPTLSRVSFQHALRSAGGPEFGRELVAKELESLRKRSDVTFDLSPTQLEHYLEARRFLDARYENLGLRFDAGAPPFVYSSPYDGAGICMTLSRSPGVLYQKGDPRERAESVALWVHELTHATASVVWGAERDSAKPSGWRFTISRAGCMLKPKASGTLGLIFEEYAACANQALFLSTLGGAKQERAEKTIRLPFGRQTEADLRLFKVFQRLCDPGTYSETERASISRPWERVFARDSSRLEIPIEVVSWRGSSDHGSGSVYPVALIDRLAGEVFPELPPAAAAERFRELSVRAHVTGQMAEILVPIRKALGQDGLLFLLEWGQDLSQIANGEESALLSLFVSAGSLGRVEAAVVRRELRDAINQKRNEGTTRTTPEGIEVEQLLFAGERREWSSWLDTRRSALVTEHSDLQAYAVERLAAALRADDFSEAADIFMAARFSDERRPIAPIRRLSQYAREILSEGRVLSYERLLDVFQPKRALVEQREAQRLVHAAVVSSLRGGQIGVFCEAATSPRFDRESLLSPEVRRLVQIKLAGTMSFMARLRLERALEGERLS